MAARRAILNIAGVVRGQRGVFSALAPAAMDNAASSALHCCFDWCNAPARALASAAPAVAPPAAVSAPAAEAAPLAPCEVSAPPLQRTDLDEAIEEAARQQGAAGVLELITQEGGRFTEHNVVTCWRQLAALASAPPPPGPPPPRGKAARGRPRRQGANGGAGNNAVGKPAAGSGSASQDSVVDQVLQHPSLQVLG